MDLKLKAVSGIKWIASNQLEIRITSEAGKEIRPLQVLTKIFSLPVEALKQARVIKLSDE